MGRTGYLAYEGNYFDKRLANITHPIGHSIGFMVSIAILLLAYELIVYLLRRILRRHADYEVVQ